jgi:hypothetical protein
MALMNVIIHVYFSYNLEFHRDELLYFSLGLHPALGFATVPPLTGWIAALMQNIFGFSIFAVRIFPAVLSGLMVLLISAITKELGGSDYARILSASGIILSIFGMRAFLLFQPVHIDIILWTLIFYLIIKYINTHSGKYLVIMGITAGAALLNKYLVGVLLTLLFVIVPFTQYRKIFRSKKFWFGMLAGFIIILPNIIWQIVNGLPVVDHLTELRRTQLINVDKSGFLTEQILMPGISSILTLTGLFYLFISKKAWKYRFLGVVVIAVIVTLLLLQGKSYYTLGVFPFLISAGAVSWGDMLEKTWTRVLMIFLMVCLTIPILPLGIPVFKQENLVSYFTEMRNNYGIDSFCRFEDGSVHPLPQDYADMLGWEELVSITDDAWQKIEDKNSAFIYCQNYGQAGAITIIGRKFGLPEAVSFHESFRYWIPHRFIPDIRSVIYVNNEMGEDVARLFGKITKKGSITNPYAREYGTAVWLCEDPVDSFNKFWTLKISAF